LRWSYVVCFEGKEEGETRLKLLLGAFWQERLTYLLGDFLQVRGLRSWKVSHPYLLTVSPSE